MQNGKYRSEQKVWRSARSKKNKQAKEDKVDLEKATIAKANKQQAKASKQESRAVYQEF